MSTSSLDTVTRGQKISWYKSFRRRLLKSPAGTVGLVIVLLFVLTAIFANVLAPRDPYRIDLRNKLMPLWFMEKGTMDRPLGTDTLGRDILSRLIYGTRTAFFLALTAVPAAAVVGALFGLIAGYFRDTWVDKVATSIAIAGVSVPHYWLGMVLVIIFSVQLGWLPASGYVQLGDEWRGPGDRLRRRDHCGPAPPLLGPRPRQDDPEAHGLAARIAPGLEGARRDILLRTKGLLSQDKQCRRY